MSVPCPDCARKFVDENALWQHRLWKHRRGGADNPNPRPKFSTDPNDAWDDDSEADIAITAQRKQAAGEPLEPWEEAYRY